MHRTRHTASLRALSCVAFTTLMAAGLGAQSIWYVNMQAAANGTGTSWNSPFDLLQDAIDVAQAGDQIWVAAGIYYPSVPTSAGDSRSATFVMPHDVAIYGGFIGNEPSVALRAGLFDATILCGDIGTPGVPFDNCYHVVTMNGTTSYVSTTLDGFTIRDGYGLGGALNPSRGAGVTVRLAGGTHTPTLIIDNCTIRENVADIGGGISVTNLGGVRLCRSKVIDNGAEDRGGGAFVQTAYLVSTSTSWLGNVAVQKGGGLYVNSTANGWVKLSNDVMQGNQADEGGGIYVAGSEFINGSVNVYNCTIACNFANAGVSIYGNTTAQQKAEIHVYNSILWHEPQTGPATMVGSGSTVTVTYSCVLGGYVGTGNISSNPLFLDCAGGDLRLRRSSPCNDAGNTDNLPSDYCDLDGDGNFLEPVPLDKAGGRRVTDNLLVPNVGVGSPPVDMGAYES